MKKSRKRRKIELNLKKQTQFAKGHNDVKSMLIMVYGDFNVPERRKNKAKQSQYAGPWPEIRKKTNGCGMITPKAQFDGPV